MYNRAYKLDPDVDKHVDHEKLSSEISKKDLSDLEPFYNPFRKFMTNSPVDLELVGIIRKSVFESKAKISAQANSSNTNSNVFKLSFGKTSETDLLTKLPEDVLESVLVRLGEMNLGSLEIASNASRSLFLACRQESLWKRLSPTSSVVNDSWRLYLIMHPHFRTDGIYISKITYFRQGYQESAISQPSHLVTYYRYLRFIRGGANGRLVMSLVTTEKPQSVIEQLRNLDLNVLKSIQLRFSPTNEKVNPNPKQMHLKNTHNLAFNSNHIVIGTYYPLKDAQNTFKLVLFDPHPKYPMRLRMILQLPDDSSGPSYRWAKCLKYTGNTVGTEHFEFDTHNWGKFFFSRVKSYVT